MDERLRAGAADSISAARGGWVGAQSTFERFERVVLMARGRNFTIGTTAELAARQPPFNDLLEAEAGSVGRAPAA